MTPPRLQAAVKEENGMSRCLCAIGLAALAVAGCAPDQFSNYRATGLNGFIDMASQQCAPLQVGPMVITPYFDPPNYVVTQYGTWLDLTSNLYYKRITPEAYTANMDNLFPGEGTAKATRCLVSKLPPPEQRPSAPPPR
jgi:hypothetical protein